VQVLHVLSAGRRPDDSDEQVQKSGKEPDGHAVGEDAADNAGHGRYVNYDSRSLRTIRFIPSKQPQDVNRRSGAIRCSGDRRIRRRSYHTA